jgi:hypothetical protein
VRASRAPRLREKCLAANVTAFMPPTTKPFLILSFSSNPFHFPVCPPANLRLPGHKSTMSAISVNVFLRSKQSISGITVIQF